jgi:endonuclease YncB( thermonuclease family)
MFLHFPRQRTKFKSGQYAAMLCMLVLIAGALPASAGDSVYGKIVEVRHADFLVLDSGRAKFEVRVIGIDVPKEGEQATKALEFVTRLLLGKNARLRLGIKLQTGVMVGRLFTDDDAGIKDVGVELVRAGLVRRQKGNEQDFGYKYGELSQAEKEAQREKRGIWANGGGK